MLENWEQVDLKTSLLRGIYGLGFEQPSPIQKESILPMLTKKDLIAQAQSGTGKTGAFCIGMLQLCTEEQCTQGVIISPTRELAIQIQGVCDGLSTQMSIKSKLLVGGSSVDADIRDLKSTTYHILIGCPGRFQEVLLTTARFTHSLWMRRMRFFLLDFVIKFVRLLVI